VTVVYPTGVNPTDVLNIQAAVNQGGSVLLKAVNASGQPTSFNFGTWPDTSSIPANSSVTLNASVAIAGEQVGGNRTTISGGVSPFYEANTGAKVSITGLKFVSPQCDAITIWRSTGLSITNNEIVGSTPFLSSGGFTESLGIFVGGAGNSTISGNVVIAGNFIHGLVGTPDEYGIYVNGVESPMTIAGNTIQIGTATDPGDGSFDSQGIAIYACAGAALVSGNNITVGPGVAYNGILVKGPATGAVTILGNEVRIDESALCYAGIGISGSTGPAEIFGNYIDSQSQSADGIALEGTSYTGTLSGVTIALNAIDIQNSDMSAVELIGAVTKSSIALNLISGNSAYGLSAETDYNPSDISSSNSFLENLFFGYSASQATIFLDTTTANNIVRGPYASVINNGTGNQISH
jgi:hypothetical protein